MHPPRVVIAGTGMLTALGCSADATWDALLAGKFIETHAAVPKKYDQGMARVTALALDAAREAIAAARWGCQETNEMGLVVGTSKGPVESWIAGKLESSGLGEVAAKVALALRMSGGPVLTMSAACASGLHALIRGAMLIQSGQCRNVLVVAAEASLHPIFIASFERLGVIPPAGVGCRPFDQRRRGFLMSEGAAAVCLEAEDGSDAANAGMVYVDRFAMGGDATHLTGSDAEGRLLRRLLASVADGRRVDLVHAHGTGTIQNDPMELAAIEATVGGLDAALPVVYSHKGALGHSLGAAGLLSVVLNWQMHRRGVVPPNVRTSAPLPVTHVALWNRAAHRCLRRSIAMAAGFGGPAAAIALRGT